MKKEGKDLPLEYAGYHYLNKQVYFKGGLPGMQVMILFAGVAFASIILINFINIIIALVMIVVIVSLIVRWAKKISKENQKGDRDYLKSSSAWDKSPRQIRDNGLLKKALQNENKFDI